MNEALVLTIWGTVAGLAATATIVAWVIARRRSLHAGSLLVQAALAALPGDLFLVEYLLASSTQPRANVAPESFWSLMWVILWIVVGPVALLGAGVGAAKGTRKGVLVVVGLNAMAWAIASYLGVLSVLLV